MYSVEVKVLTNHKAELDTIFPSITRFDKFGLSESFLTFRKGFSVNTHEILKPIKAGSPELTD